MGAIIWNGLLIKYISILITGINSANLKRLVKFVYVHAPQPIDGERTQSIEIVYDMVGMLPLTLLNGDEKTA
ncbi:MAG: DUF4368 domain-containing protein [Clostridia bacterium]|nr:DUF4368 domain-containing protein [Clostridia bacterium]